VKSDGLRIGLSCPLLPPLVEWQIKRHGFKFEADCCPPAKQPLENSRLVRIT
jgi:hypothetical protein